MRGVPAIRWFCGLALAVAGSGCVTNASPQPAQLTNTDAQTMARVKAVLGNALGTNLVELGASETANGPVFSVLPAQLRDFDGRSLAKPVLFDLVKAGSACFLVARSNGQSYPLKDVACAAIPKKS